MPTGSTVSSLAKISQYLWTAQLAQDNAFKGGSKDSGRDLVLMVENYALQYGINNSLAGLEGVTLNEYRLCGAKLQEANQILTGSSGGGVIVNPSTGVSTLVPYYSDYVVGDSGAPITAGQTSYTINIGQARIFSASSVSISRDQAVLPQDKPGYVSYTVSYDTVTGLVTITFSEAVQDSQLYIVQFYYLVV